MKKINLLSLALVLLLGGCSAFQVKQKDEIYVPFDGNYGHSSVFFEKNRDEWKIEMEPDMQKFTNYLANSFKDIDNYRVNKAMQERVQVKIVTPVVKKVDIDYSDFVERYYK